MKSIGLKILKNRLSEYVRMASSGEVILITDRDQVVAELVAPRQERSLEIADAVLAEGVRNGWVKPPALPKAGPPGRRPVTTFKRLMQDLDRDRSER